jgi:hypothetical protein
LKRRLSILLIISLKVEIFLWFIIWLIFGKYFIVT